MALQKMDSTLHLLDMMYKEQEKRLQLTALIKNLMLSLIASSIGCMTAELAREEGASLFAFALAIFLSCIICWIRYRNKMKKIK